MKLQEAYKILELSNNASPEEIKKQYRKLTKLYHPDVNKEPGAEDKFKKINEAYQCVNNKNTQPENYQQYRTVEHIELSCTISFKEAVLGTKKEIKYQRHMKCQDCQGKGQKPINTNCDKCKGKGQIISKQGNMIFARTCDKCNWQMKFVNCNTCSGDGSVLSDVKVDVSIPGGISNNNVLRLAGMGNFTENFFGMEHNTDVFLHVSVIPEENMQINGINVISDLNISLVEAIKGCQKTIKTIKGDREITIKPLSKHKDEVAIPSLGVNGVGNHIVILSVEYPENISELINNL